MVIHFLFQTVCLDCGRAQYDGSTSEVFCVRVCILTRGDIFPTNHGAAVKIVRTAEALSMGGEPCFVVTDDREFYLRFDAGVMRQVAYPPRVRAAQEWPGLASAGAWAERILGRLGYPQEEYFLYRPMLDPGWWVRAVAVGELEQIDVFQAEFPGYGVPAWIAARFTGRRHGAKAAAKCSVVQHNVEWDRLTEFGRDVKWIRPIEQWVLDRMDEVIAVSTDDRDRMVSAGTNLEKISVIPHGVDVERFERGSRSAGRVALGLESDVPVLFFHGTLHYWPNTEAVRFIVEELVPRIAPRIKDLRVVISGQSPPEHFAHPCVQYTGSVKRIEDYVAAADVCVCPIFSGGGTRMKLLEYMAGSRAIVSTTKGAEGIQYETGREIMIADDAQSMADAAISLFSDSALRHQMGRMAHAFAAAYGWRAVGEASHAVYRGEGRGQDWNPRFRSMAQPVIDAHLPALRAESKPRTMLLLINRGCNLRCSFCDLWSQFENMDVRGRLVPLLDEAVAIGTQTLVITGGEPFLHPELFVAVEEAKLRGLSVNITTNGTLIDKRWDELSRSGVDSLSFSIDGMQDSHDELRGRDGAWEKTLSGLRRVRRSLPNVATSIYFVVTNQNVEELTQIYDLACAEGAKFDFWPVNDAPDLFLRTKKDKAAWTRAIRYIAEQDDEVAERAAYYEASMAYHAGESGPVRCLGLIDQYGVTYEGNLLPCCVWGGDGLVVGNVFETPLRELWTSEVVQAHREGMFHEGCSVGCYNHSLYEFEVATGEPFRLGQS